MTHTIDPTCPASRHGSTYAYQRFGCRCPAVVDQVRQWQSWKRRRPQVKADRAVGFSSSRDYDRVCVVRAVDGQKTRLTVTERADAIDRLDRQGLPAWRIAEQLGCAERTVTRRRVARRTERQVAA